MAQSVKHLTGSGRDLMVCEFQPLAGLCADRVESGTCFIFCVCLSLCPSPPRALSLSVSLSKINIGDTWVTQSVERLTSAQVMISRSVSSSPVSGSVLTARSLEPASDSVSPSLSAPPLLTHCLSLKNK